MSKYTTQVRWIVEANSDEGQPITKRIKQACPKIFDFDYPIWADSYRPILEEKIVKHYFNKEIGLETVGLWKLYLDERLNLIMPCYNDLYATTVKDYDYMVDVDYTDDLDITRETDNKTIEIGNNSKTGNTNKTGTIKKVGESESIMHSNATDLKNFDGKLQSTNRTDTKTDDNRNYTNTDTGKNTTKGDEEQITHTVESDTPQANYAAKDYATRLVDNDLTTRNNNLVDTTLKTVSTDIVHGIVDTSIIVNDTTTNKGLDTLIRDTTDTINTTDNTDTSDLITSTDNGTHDITNSGNEVMEGVDKRRKVGLNGSRSFTDLLMQYRASLINIDKMIIDELSDLFMLIY